MLTKIASFLRRARSERGFTLIELVIVIGIIGVLAGIAVPRYTNSVADARKTADRMTARVVQTAIDLYFAQNGSFPDATTLDDLYGVLITAKCLRDEPDFQTEGITVAYDATEGLFTVTIP